MGDPGLGGTLHCPIRRGGATVLKNKNSKKTHVSSSCHSAGQGHCKQHDSSTKYAHVAESQYLQSAMHWKLCNYKTFENATVQTFFASHDMGSFERHIAHTTRCLSSRFVHAAAWGASLGMQPVQLRQRSSVGSIAVGMMELPHGRGHHDWHVDRVEVVLAVWMQHPSERLSKSQALANFPSLVFGLSSIKETKEGSYSGRLRPRPSSSFAHQRGDRQEDPSQLVINLSQGRLALTAALISMLGS
jgi:hypothetical protein